MADTSPGVTLSLVGFLAALPPYALLRRTSRGRARSAIAYLSGLGAGLGATAMLAAVFQSFVYSAVIVEPGLFSAFFCPFIGMARAKWDKPRKRTRSAAVARSASR